MGDRYKATSILKCVVRSVHWGNHMMILVALFFLFPHSPSAHGKTPERIVSLSLAGDEILMALIPRCGGVERVVALSTFADDVSLSHVVEEAKKVKSRAHSEPESLLRLKPDLVIAASFNRQELLELIRKSKIPMVLLENFDKAEDIAVNISKIAVALDCQQEGGRLIRGYWESLDSIKPRLSAKKPSVLSYNQDLIVMGKDTLFDDMVRRAGAINLASEWGLIHWPRIDAERLIKSNPDFVIVIGDDSKAKRDAIRSHPVWRQLKAVKEDRLIFIEEKIGLSASHHFARGPRSLLQGIERFQRNQ